MLKKKYSKIWLSEEEIEKIFNCEKIKQRDLLIMKLEYLAGLRISEAINLKKEDFIKEANRTYVIIREQKKDKKNWEKQPIPSELYSEVIRYCNEKGIRSQDNVIQSQMSKTMTRQRAWQIVKECAEKAGINKDATNHAFRRSRITHLLEKDFGDTRTSGFVRHKKLASIDPYVKLAKSKLFDKMEETDKK